MDTIDEPQITDYYTDEPNGVRIINKLNGEFDEVQKEMDKVKQKMKTYRSFYDKHKRLRLPTMSAENREVFEGVLQDLCESVNHPNLDPIFYVNNHIYWISRKLNELTGKKNEEACKHYIKTKLGELAIEHMNWLCSCETIVEKFMEDL
jgi:hypothetical protein